MRKVVTDADGHARLLASCFHWFRMAHGMRRDDELPIAEDCALCERWYDTGCAMCPVLQTTGYADCMNSPYARAARAEDSFGIDSPQFRVAARAMLDFLCDLAESVEVTEP